MKIDINTDEININTDEINKILAKLQTVVRFPVTTLDETTLIGAVRHRRDYDFFDALIHNYSLFEEDVAICLLIADLLELPDDELLVPTVAAAMTAQMNDPGTLHWLDDYCQSIGWNSTRGFRCWIKPQAIAKPP